MNKLQFIISALSGGIIAATIRINIGIFLAYILGLELWLGLLPHMLWHFADHFFVLHTQKGHIDMLEQRVEFLLAQDCEFGKPNIALSEFIQNRRREANETTGNPLAIMRGPLRTVVFMNPSDLSREAATNEDYEDYLTLIETNAPPQLLSGIYDLAGSHEDFVKYINKEGFYAEIIPKPYEVYQY